MQLFKVNLVALILGAIAGYLIAGPVLAVILAASAVAGVMVWYNFATGFVLTKLKAVRLTEASAGNPIYRTFLGDAYKLVEKAGLPRTKFAVIDAPLPLAFSLGSAGSGGWIVVTTGLFKTLTRLEMASVTAHELGHIKAGERTTAAMHLGFSLMLSSTGLRPVFHVLTLGLFRAADHKFRRISQGMLRPDCRADAFAAELCKDSAILASALHKLERGVRASSWDALEGSPLLARLAIVNPRQAVYSFDNPERSPLGHRVAELKRLTLSDVKAA